MKEKLNPYCLVLNIIGMVAILAIWFNAEPENKGMMFVFMGGVSIIVMFGCWILSRK